jgi:flagellin
MTNSVNTNVGALVALQNLNATNSQLQTTQARINTGLKVASAKDNGSIWAIAQSQRSESQAINAVKESLSRGVSTVDVAMSAGEQVSDLLLQMKEKVLAAADTGLNATSRQSLQDDYRSLASQVTTVVNNASFNGVNMLKGAAAANAGTTVQSLANADATSTIDVSGVNMQFDAAGINIDISATAFTGGANDAADAAKAKTLITNVDAAIKQVSANLSALGTGSKALSSHLSFMSKLQDTLDAGVGNLVDADLAKESANLQALQTKQQLGIQALSIANQSSSILLGLFR